MQVALDPQMNSHVILSSKSRSKEITLEPIPDEAAEQQQLQEDAHPVSQSLPIEKMEQGIEIRDQEVYRAESPTVDLDKFEEF